MKNLAEEPCRWELLPSDIDVYRRDLRARGFRVIGLFHSHPLTQAKLGPRDRRNTPTGWTHLVYDVCGREPRLYAVRRRGGRRHLDALALTVERKPHRPKMTENPN
jgi:proteasome lid subunit RPN8/RPN11